MMFRLLSDLHLEFGPIDLPIVADEDDTVLVLAGDIGLADNLTSFESFIGEMSDRFREIVWINGNHEYYGSSIVRAPQKIQQHLTMLGITNVTYGDNFTVVVDGVAYICSTLWTDMNDRDPLTLHNISYMMNDFRLIRNGPPSHPYTHKLKPIDLVHMFDAAKTFIFGEIVKHKELGHKTVVVTHHGPSELSIHPTFKGDKIMNGGYVSSLGNDIAYNGPDIWVHGHTHFSFDYIIGETRIIVNPRGYVGHSLNPDFDPLLTVRLV